MTTYLYLATHSLIAWGENETSYLVEALAPTRLAYWVRLMNRVKYLIQELGDQSLEVRVMDDAMLYRDWDYENWMSAYLPTASCADLAALGVLLEALPPPRPDHPKPELTYGPLSYDACQLC